jgi:hypothetical protein
MAGSSATTPRRSKEVGSDERGSAFNSWPKVDAKIVVRPIEVRPISTAPS